MAKLKYIISAMAAILTMTTAVGYAQTQNTPEATELVKRMSAKIKAMWSYEADFSVETAGQPIHGYYAVSGQSYYLRINEAEVFCDGSKRCEVIPENREITIDIVSDQTDLLSNPARAFELLDSDFSIGFADPGHPSRANIAQLRLVPTKDDFPFGTIYVEIDLGTYLPKSICYDFDGDRIDIRIDSIRKLEHADTSLFQFDAAKYPDYVVIDLTE